MDITPRSLALLLAALVFAVSAFWMPAGPPRVSLVSLGLFLVAVALLLARPAPGAPAPSGWPWLVLAALIALGVGDPAAGTLSAVT